jgi:hypothetical protein
LFELAPFGCHPAGLLENVCYAQPEVGAAFVRIFSRPVQAIRDLFVDRRAAGGEPVPAV